MDSATAKSPQVLPTGDEEAQTTRAVVFPDEDGEIHEEKLHHHLRPKGVEMKREMTKEDKELAAANFLTDTNTRERTAANQTSGTLTFMKISLDLSSSARLLTPILTRRIQHTLMA